MYTILTAGDFKGVNTSIPVNWANSSATINAILQLVCRIKCSYFSIQFYIVLNF